MGEIANGSGSGSGDGSGYGYGSGSGSGDGYGDGDGSGDGSGDEKQNYFSALLRPFQAAETIVGFWRCEKDMRPANGGTGNPRIVGTTEKLNAPLKICTVNALHATFDPSKWKGERWCIVRLAEPVQIQEDKIASLERQILADLGKCPFS